MKDDSYPQVSKASPGTFLSLSLLLVSFFLINPLNIMSQNLSDSCPEYKSSRADKVYEKAIRAYTQRDYSECIGLMKEVTQIEPDYADAYFVLGLIYIKESRMNLKAAKQNFLKVISICPGYDVYAYYHLARIAYGAQDFKAAFDYISIFLEDVDKIKTDQDYDEAARIKEFSKFYADILSNPVPFDPKPVPGISTEYDEYLPIISPDNEMALFTRKLKLMSSRDDLTSQTGYKERFMYSYRNEDEFDRGNLMPAPFNKFDNEGGATITINNRTLYYTLCKFATGKSYYNCDICTSENINGTWMPITNLGERVNSENTWESQPSITSDGKTLYFVSDRAGGLGGYDIYKTQKDETGEWSVPVNLGSTINTAGNEKAPFIHTDSQTLYFSSDGKMGLGGYDIFFSKLREDGTWSEPKNIGYPINSFDDDVGFFVSTDGHYGYFASNKFAGFGGWDLYSFDLYEGARPEKVLIVKGKISNLKTKDFNDVRVEVKNVETRKIQQLEVDTLTGEYFGAVLLRDDYIMTVRKKGYVQETKYISKIETRNSMPLKLTMELKPIEVGKSYRLNDVYFDFNSIDLKPESVSVIGEFFRFLLDNPTMKVSIEGHTDNIGNEQDNLQLSQQRARAVYDELIKLGITEDRLGFKGFGESKPIDTNETEEGRAKNRRTVFVIIEK
jgi:outer membrane protein OmpA-like peptidoglycan-associated protein/tetratricopeptide (TPR) repeat protein